jgi:drug/metabolite transporter (DMT)-like permease
VEAVSLKRALLGSTPAAPFGWWVGWWAVLGFGMSAAALAVVPLLTGRRRKPRTTSAVRAVGAAGGARNNAGPYLLLGLTTGVMQLCTLLAFRGLQVGYALALFETSTLLTVVLGYKVFREPHFARRMAGSAVMVAGAAMIVCAK